MINAHFLPQSQSIKTEVTLSIDENLIREVQALAIRHGISLEHLMEEALERLIRSGEVDYETAKARALARLAAGYDLGWTPPESRDELYLRALGDGPERLDSPWQRE